MLSLRSIDTATIISLIIFYHQVVLAKNYCVFICVVNQKHYKMKTLNIILVIAFVCTSIFAMAQAKQETVKVYGNCNSCKKHIETAAKEAGATSAVWNKDTKVLSLKFDAAKTDSKKIQAKVAAAGYDTQDATATKEAYDKLDECCQYERKTAAKPTSMISNKNNCTDMACCTKANCTTCNNSKACSKDCGTADCTKNCCTTSTTSNSASDKSTLHNQIKSLTFTTVNGNVVVNTINCCTKS